MTTYAMTISGERFPLEDMNICKEMVNVTKPTDKWVNYAPGAGLVLSFSRNGKTEYYTDFRLDQQGDDIVAYIGEPVAMPEWLKKQESEG